MAVCGLFFSPYSKSSVSTLLTEFRNEDLFGFGELSSSLVFVGESVDGLSFARVSNFGSRAEDFGLSLLIVDSDKRVLPPLTSRLALNWQWCFPSLVHEGYVSLVCYAGCLCSLGSLNLSAVTVCVLFLTNLYSGVYFPTSQPSG